MNQQIEKLIAIASNAKLKHAFIHEQQATAKSNTKFSQEPTPNKAFLAATDGNETGFQMHSKPTLGEHHKAFLAGPAS